MKYPEILAPVGNWEMAKAAVHNGADAIYLGLPGFNTRGRTELLSIDTVKGIINFCHLYDTKVFLAANILIFERELSETEALIEEVIPLNPDAFIVQDIGLVGLIRAICPEQPVHASTQMTITSYEALEMTADLAMQRYVLGRENSIEEIKRIRGLTDKELEVFVHGALCVSYSGQCLTSESFGGRSANRGQCAQSCRLPYELIVDGNRIDNGKRPYIVSPQDLCSIDDVPRLIEAGIDSFKIEGRLKSPAYVSDTVRQYRAAMLNLDPPLTGKSKDAKHELAQTYSRGFFNGWLDGVNHQALVDGRYSNHHGIEVGTVIACQHRKSQSGVIADMEYPIEPGDGLLFCDFSLPVVEQKIVGASVFSVEKGVGDREVLLGFANDFDLHLIVPGMKVFNNKSPRLEKELSRSYLVREELRRLPICFELSGSVGAHCTLTLTDGSNRQVSAVSDQPLARAEKSPLNKEKISSELSSLSHTPFFAQEVVFAIDEDVFIPNQIIKELKRKVIESMIILRQSRPVKSINRGGLKQLRSLHSKNPGITSEPQAALSVLVRDVSQIEACRDLGLDTIYLDFEYGKEYHDAASMVRSLGAQVGIATTRIYKPGELGHLKVIERIRPDSILVRNLGALYYFQDRGIPLRGDFSLNITNSLSAQWFLSKQLETISPSYDLNAEQLYDLLDQIGGTHAEVTIHQYMPAFHMEHCVYAAFLSTGKSFHDCGKPCERHRVELRDPKGVLHPLKPDGECRNTMFNGRAQSAIRLIPTLREKGIFRFRLEALFESSAELRQKILTYQLLLSGKELTLEALQRLEATERYGITDGQLFNIRAHQDRRKGAF